MSDEEDFDITFISDVIFYLIVIFIINSVKMKLNPKPPMYLPNPIKEKANKRRTNKIR
jgi:hypothetical protein